MSTGYIRQSAAEIIPSAVVKSSSFNNELNKVRDAFKFSTDGSTGHTHDGSSDQGSYIPLIADIDANNKLVVDAATNRISFYNEVSSSPIEQVRFEDGVIKPVTDNDIDLGTSTLEFKDLYLDGTAKVDTLAVDENATIAGTLGVTGATTVAALTSSGTITANTLDTVDLDVSGTASLGDSLSVTGNLSTGSNLSAGGALSVTGDTSVTNLGISGSVTSNITGSGDLTISGTTSLQGVTLGGVLNLGSNRITNVSNPTLAQDAATKTYVDNIIGSSLEDVFNYVGTYSPSTTYSKFEIVSDAAGSFISLIDSNLGNDPSTSPSEWDSLFGDVYALQTSPTGSLILSTGTTAQRDGTPSTGYIRYNTDLTSPEVYNGTDWVSFVGSNYEEFTSSGTWTKPLSVTWVYVEAVGAGGGGGSGMRGISGAAYSGGAGGGGGSFSYKRFLASDLASTITVTIGAGGAGGAESLDGNDGVIGGNTTFGALVTAYGGGAGRHAAPSTTTASGGGGGGTLGPGGLGSDGRGADTVFGGADGGLGVGASASARDGQFSWRAGNGGGAGSGWDDTDTEFSPGVGGSNGETGDGGDGGAGNFSGTGVAGSNGGVGSGGGGGGTAIDPNPGAAGGDGGDGRVRVWAWS